MVDWTVRIGVHGSWVADGFNLTAEDLKQAILSHMLGYAYEDEVEVEVLYAPDPEFIERIQNGES